MHPSCPPDEASAVPQNRRRVLPSLAFAVLAFSAICLLSGCMRGDIAARAATSQIGRPYVYGGASPASGFDCSGLTMWAWRVAGKQLPRTAAAQYAATYPVARKKLQLGDLAFYRSGSTVSHVAMYIGHQVLVQAQKPGYPIERVPLGWWGDHLVGYGRLR